MDLYSEFKSFYTSNIILFIILLFVIVYLIINWKKILSGDILYGELVKPILISGIIFLIIHLFLTLDNKENNYDNDIIIPKFKLGQNSQSLTNKYKIINNSLDVKSIGNQDKLSNQHIFISQKNLNKYGLKF